MISPSTPISRLVTESLKKPTRSFGIISSTSDFGYDIDLLTMHLKSCCALLLLALVACQAAPSPQTEEEPIEELSKELNIEETDAEEKDRSKKSTTLCVEFSSGKEHQVPCNQVQQPAVLVQEQPNQLWFLQQSQSQQQPPQTQTVVVQPGSQPIVQPTPQNHIIHVQGQPQHQQNLVVPTSQQQVLHSNYPTVQIVQSQPQQVQVGPQPTVQVQTRPSVQVQTRPSVQVQTRPSVQVQTRPSVQVQSQPSVQVQSQPTLQVQSQPTTVQVQSQPTTVQVQSQPTLQVQSQPTTVQVQSQPTILKPQQTLQVQTRPTVQVLQHQPVQQHTHLIQVQTQPQPQQQQSTIVVPGTSVPQKAQIVVPQYKVESSAPCASEVVIQPQVELITPSVVPQVIQQQPTIIELPAGYLEGQSEDELYECSCHPGKQNLKSKYSKLTDILTVYPGAAIVANPLYSGSSSFPPDQFVSGNSFLSGGQFVSTNQLASSPIISGASFAPATSTSFESALTDSTSLGSAISGSASLGPAISGSASFGPIASSASFGPIASSASLGSISSSTSAGLTSGSTSFKSPLLEYNVNAGIAPVNFEQGFKGARHHKKVPAQFSVQIPVSIANAPVSYPSVSSVSVPQYYSVNSYYPSTGTAPNSYNPYSTYYENSYFYPNAYSNVNPPENNAQMITVNASGYRESTHTDNGQDNNLSTTDKPQKETSTTSNAEENVNKKRETDFTQMNEATQEQKEQTPTVSMQ